MRQGLRNLVSGSLWKWENGNNRFSITFKNFVQGYPICVEKCNFPQTSSKLISWKWGDLKFLLHFSLETIFNSFFISRLKIVNEQLGKKPTSVDLII